MAKREREFFEFNTFLVMGNTRRMRDAFRGLKQMGKTVYFFDENFESNPAGGKFSGMAELPGPVEAAICDGAGEKVKTFINKAADAGIENLWINFMSDSREAVELARRRNLNLLHGQCAVVWLPTRGPHHTMHRALWKLLGKY